MPADTDDRHTVLFSDFLQSLTRLMTARPLLSLLAMLGLCVGCGVYTARNLQFKNDRADLIDPEADFQKRWLNYTKSFGEASDIVVVVEAKSRDAIEPVLDELGARLKSDSQHFRNVLYKVDHDHLRRKGLQFLTPAQLEMCLAQLREMRPVIQGDWDRVNLEVVVTQLMQRLTLLQMAAAATGSVNSASPESTSEPITQMIGRHVTALAVSMADALKNPDSTRIPWAQFDNGLADKANKSTYFLNDSGTQGFLQVVPVEDKVNIHSASLAITRLREIIAEVKPDHPQVRIGLTGIPVLEHDEMTRSQTDMTVSTIVSCIGVLLLLLAGFHGFRHPLLAMIMLAAGLLWSCAFATAFVGHLTILSASFAAILMGLGIDFAIVYLSRYLELRRAGQGLDAAIENTSASIGASILTAAITTALAFYCATFTKFLGVAELGLIAGGGVMLCAIASFLVLPPLIRLADKNVAATKLPTPIQGNLLRLATLRFPWVVTIVGLTLLGFVGSRAIQWNEGRPTFAIKYDYNLLNLQAAGVESVEIQHRMFEKSNGSLLFAVSLADSPEKARALKAEFEKLPTVRKVEELASHLQATPPEETKLLIQAVYAEVSRLAPLKYEPRMINPSALGKLIERLYQTVTKSDDAWAKEASSALDDFLERFGAMPMDHQIRFLNEFQKRMNFSLHAQLQTLAESCDSEPITESDFPEELVSRFVSPQKQWLLQIFPKEQIWDIEPLKEFVEDVRSLDPEVTGIALQNYEASLQIMHSYQDAAGYAFIAICVTLLIDLLGRRQAMRVLIPPAVIIAVMWGVIRWNQSEINWELLGGLYLAMAVTIALLLDAEAVFYCVLALLPPVGGAAIMFGVMRQMHVDLNPANLIVLPLLLGIGVDGGVHVIHDFRLQAKRRYRISPSIINSLVLTSTTTMVGFGSMLLAAHRGLYTFGLVLTIGVGSCVFVSLVPLPAILTLLDRRRRKKVAGRRVTMFSHEFGALPVSNTVLPNAVLPQRG